MNKIIFLSLIFFNLNIFGAVGCMDNSKHTDNCDGYDYKKLEYVSCLCNCSQYDIDFVRGICKRCGHSHDPADFNF